ncbi:MAG: hypothetical protein UW41_C0010G0030 [Candidatus Collierbacteria bacterium GW2011_GWC2_44_18]|uniref:Transcription elongation factor GreA/GreB N-terminal domain-containing protein n=1 Tax=Candidatus Collierbacteria bacterium GW2011_GWC2_44_18 TaxID=1618392 RepID=A0A0G1HPU6_9BACT|nr:MAG: hypothetical protein UW41_C0010G0030 [Candidatus Collierbacteria bacterium GW2011_GWC2_44_18]
MTQSEKLEQLQAKLKVAEEKLAKAMKEQGEACGDACDWHDNNVYDLATSPTNTYQVFVDDLMREIRDLQKSK